MILWGIVATSFLLNYTNNDFSIHYHGDERAKVYFILEGGGNFRHPLLLLQIGRSVNWFAGFSDEQEVVVLSRTVSAAFGALTVLGTFLLSRRLLGGGRALLVAGATALLPILVVHAHYVKEDLLLTCFCIAALCCLTKFFQNRSRASLLMLGVSAGLAFSSKYVGFLLVPVILLAPLLCAIPDKADAYRGLLVSLGISVAVFLVVNSPIFFDLLAFEEGLAFEATHVIEGHTTRVSPVSNLLSFHSLNSVVPGMTWVLAYPAALYMVYSIVRWKGTGSEERLLLLYALVFYLAVEVTPMKAFPGFIRYVCPIVPVLAYFSFRAVEQLCRYVSPARSAALSTALFMLCMAYPAYESVQLVVHLTRDTRAQLIQFLEDNPGRAISEQYGLGPHDVRYLWGLRGRRIPRGTKYLISSSFKYDRFFYAVSKGNPTRRDRRRYEFYRDLFTLPYVEIGPAYKSFAFSNPTLRIHRVSDIRAAQADGRVRLGLLIR